MDDGNLEDKPLSSMMKSSRFRSPTFSREEVQVLIELVEKYKFFILNKSTTSAASQSKEAAWTKLSKSFNAYGFKVVRSAETLKTKWENLKREGRRLSKDVMDTKSSDFNELFSRVVALICEADNIGCIDNPRDFSEIDISDNGSEDNKDITDNSNRFWDESREKQSDDEDEETDEKGRNGRLNRSLNFSPQECRLLLQCVRQEKNTLFSKRFSASAVELKNRAWSRVTNSYNKLSPQKRSTKVLRTKFCNMKSIARKVGLKTKDKSKKTKIIDRGIANSNEEIKKEPKLEYNLNLDSDLNEDMMDDNFIANDNEYENFVSLASDRPDPLSSVLKGDSGIGSTHMGTCNQSENEEIVKLKTDLLNYRMETAKLERQRVENAIKEETAARMSRELESAFRLRAARLDVAAAEMKLPPSHPALHYTTEERRAQQYLSQYHGT